jgi:hypothetical protein
MKTIFALLCSLALWVLAAGVGYAEGSGAPKETSVGSKPLGIDFSVKMVGPYMEAADLQIICLFKHKPGGGDIYQGAAKDSDEKLGGLLSSLRNRGEFVGELGETIVFTPPQNSIPAKRFMVIGLGDEKDLSVETLHLVGRIAAREAVRQKAEHVGWAPVIRDEGSTKIDVGEGDRAFVEGALSAYDTELRLQKQGLADPFTISKWVIDAGPTFFDAAVEQVGKGIEAILPTLAKRDSTPYSSLTK